MQAEAQAIRSKYLQQRWLRLVAQQHDFDKTLASATPGSAAQGGRAARRRGRAEDQEEEEQGMQEEEGQGKQEGEEQHCSSASWYVRGRQAMAP